MRQLQLILVIICSSLIAGPALAQSTAYSKPSGFVTHTLKAGQLNLIGLTLHEPVVWSGTFDVVEGTVLTDNDADFNEKLTTGKSYILEIVDNSADASLNGVLQVINSWTSNQINTPDNLEIDGLANGVKYKLRAPKSLSDVFGVANSAGLTVGTNLASSDVIWLHNGNGFDKFYYSKGGGFGGGTAGWKNSNGDDADDQPIIYTDAVLIQSRASKDKQLVVSGVVKTKAVTLCLIGKKFNFISSTFPVGSTLANSGLQAHLGDGSVTDIIWMPNGEGAFIKYSYNGVNWVDEAGIDASDTPLASGIIIERSGPNSDTKLNPPATYNDL